MQLILALAVCEINYEASQVHRVSKKGLRCEDASIASSSGLEEGIGNGVELEMAVERVQYGKLGRQLPTSGK